MNAFGLGESFGFSGSWVAVGISAVPPFVLLAVTHLTMLMRDQADVSAVEAVEPAVAGFDVTELELVPA
ncbi:hypothetical protein [Nocardia sp. NPDC049149]|uniref:hypothetical protein n=1 Tax=Nocardia sp. NPDC049149 TaxID=3364315 RepID=UPI00371C6B38